MSFLERVLEASTGSPPDRQLERRRRFRLGCGLAAAFQSRLVSRVVVRHTVLPAAEGNAHPFVCQRPYGRVVRFVFVIALRAVIGLCPVTVENRLAGPLMEGLPQKFRTTPAPMHPVLLSAGFGHRGDPRVLLDLGGVRIAVTLRAKGSDQTGNQYIAGAWQGIDR